MDAGRRLVRAGGARLMTERDARCTCDLVRRSIVPEEHNETCPVVANPMRSEIQLAQAVLLFHRGGPWTEEDRAAWLALTGSDEATTRTLCDLARRVLQD